MKKIITVLSISLAAIFFTSGVSAKTATAPGQQTQAEVRQRIEERKQILLQKREALSQRIQEKKATIEAKLRETRKVRIRAYWTRLNTRFMATINRLYRLIERIESRLAIIEKEEGAEIGEIKEQLEVVKEQLEEIETNIQAANDNIENVLSSNNPKEAFSEIRDIIKEARDNLIEVHRTLVHVIGDIRGLRVGASKQPEATDSASD